MTPAPDPRLGNPEWADNWTLGTGVRFELIEIATQRVFLCQQAVTSTEVGDFEAPDGFAHVLAGAAQADMAFFARSPGASQDGPVATLALGGRSFAYVAQPAGIEELPSGAVDMTIDKHHATLYRAGRTIDVLDFGDGTAATPAWGSVDPDVALTSEMLADGWALRRIELAHDLLAAIPNPARVIVLDGAFGFHGPVDSVLIDTACIPTRTQETAP